MNFSPVWRKTKQLMINSVHLIVCPVHFSVFIRLIIYIYKGYFFLIIFVE